MHICDCYPDSISYFHWPQHVGFILLKFLCGLRVGLFINFVNLIVQAEEERSLNLWWNIIKIVKTGMLSDEMGEKESFDITCVKLLVRFMGAFTGSLT